MVIGEESVRRGQNTICNWCFSNATNESNQSSRSAKMNANEIFFDSTPSLGPISDGEPRTDYRRMTLQNVPHRVNDKKKGEEVMDANDTGIVIIEQNDDLTPPLPTLKGASDSISSASDYQCSYHMPKFQLEMSMFQHKMNRFQRFVAHEDFGLFLLLACKVKVIRNNLLCGNAPDTTDVIRISHIESTQGEAELSQTARNIQMKLLFRPHANSIDWYHNGFPRGICRDTDILIGESIISLCQEFNRCMTWYVAMKGQVMSQSPLSKKVQSEVLDDEIDVEVEDASPLSDKNAIVVKYSKFQTDILTEWMIKHKVGRQGTSSSFFNQCEYLIF